MTGIEFIKERWYKRKKVDYYLVAVFGMIIQKLIDEDEIWIEGSYTLSHKSGIKIWIANFPIIDTEIYAPNKMRLKLRQKYLLWKAVQVCRVNQIKRIMK